jgi:hypothetical protein
MSTYEERLEKWKLDHGAQLGDTDEDAILRAADKKLPGDSYCVLCGKGPQPISGMVLITYMDDPYKQSDPEEGEDRPDGNPPVAERIRACPECWKEEYGEEEET